MRKVVVATTIAVLDLADVFEPQLHLNLLSTSKKVNKIVLDRTEFSILRLRRAGPHDRRPRRELSMIARPYEPLWTRSLACCGGVCWAVAETTRAKQSIAANALFISLRAGARQRVSIRLIRVPHRAAAAPRRELRNVEQLRWRLRRPLRRERRGSMVLQKRAGGADGFGAE